MSRSNLRIDGPRAWSYGTCIKDVLPNGMTIGNISRYSPTTTRHQDEVWCDSCDVVIGGVPQSTYNLAEWFMGLVGRLGFRLAVAANNLFGIGDDEDA